LWKRPYFYKEAEVKKEEQKINRREFVKRAAMGTVGLGALLSGLGPSLFVSESLGQEKGLKYRPLGKTGLKVSEISFGGIYIAEAAVLEAAIDKGVNLIHTSYRYQRGDSPLMFGRVLRKPGMRDKVCLAIRGSTREDRLDRTLRTLGTDHADIMVLPVRSDRGVQEINSPRLEELFAILKEKKKIRFCGIAFHGNMAEIMRAAIKRGIFDVMLVRYDLTYRDSLDPLIAEAKKAGIGFIAMKTVKEYREVSYKDTLKKLLENKDVSSLLVGMKSIQEVEEDLSASAG
jgi:predicted aldo/keto reductase-like oxidoreductase